jgi:hypothetical protein
VSLTFLGFLDSFVSESDSSVDFFDFLVDFADSFSESSLDFSYLPEISPPFSMMAFYNFVFDGEST